MPSRIIHRDGAAPVGVESVVIDGAALADKHALLSAMAAALEFPDYFSPNWDAFEETLRDLFAGTSVSRAVEITDSIDFELRCPSDAATLQTIWADVGDEFADQVCALHLVLG